MNKLPTGTVPFRRFSKSFNSASARQLGRYFPWNGYWDRRSVQDAPARVDLQRALTMGGEMN